MPPSAWDHFSDSPGEFLISADVFISNSAGTSLRKTKSRKFEKKDSTGEDSKLKEKSSSNWLFAQKSINAAGHWRPATCRLTEEGERCLLNIYVDESILYQTVYVHLLNQTDIRPTETSLFYRKDCLVIFCISGQRWMPSNAVEPLYLSFPNPETCATWQALLKSYAIPEIYGRWYFPSEGGSYRMWRQVDLTVIQGRNLGLSKPETGGKDDSKDGDNSDIDVSCEIHLNSVLCSRTTVKRSLASPDWHENFNFPGLPPFENLEIVVWRERKMSKPVSMGSTRISLSNFRRGEPVEGWFPVVQPRQLGTESRVGDLRLKIRVDEEVILPYQSYMSLMETCQSRNCLDWVSNLESRLKLKNVSTHLMSIAIANNNLVEQVRGYASREVEKSSTSHQTIFRGNTTLTKVVELCMNWYGKSFLEASIGPVLRRLCSEKVAMEVDPVRSGKSNKDVEKNVEQLKYWCQEFWNQIYSVRAECPNELRSVFKTIRNLVEQRYRGDPNAGESHSYLPWQSVSAFIFLRFIVPAILHPHLFGLYPGLPPLPVQRSLTLIAKVIQSLANLNVKENFMRGIQDFLKDSLFAMMDYLAVISTPVDGVISIGGGDEISCVANALRQRTNAMSILERESVPTLPHLLDIPKHLAMMTSAVIRHSKELCLRSQTDDEIGQAVNEFCLRCFEVEEEALSRVSQLATALASNNTQNCSQQANDEIDAPMPSTITSMAFSTSARARRRTISRPSTAPSPVGLIISHPDISQGSESAVTSTQERPRMTLSEQGQRQWNSHVKAPSAGALPKLIRDVSVAPHTSTASTTDRDDDPARRKKGLLRILRR